MHMQRKYFLSKQKKTSLGIGLPGASNGKESVCNVGDLGLIPGLGRSPEGGHDNPLQYSCLENSMDREAWWVTQFMGSQRDRTEQLGIAQLDINIKSLKDSVTATACFPRRTLYFPPFFFFL